MLAVGKLSSRGQTLTEQNFAFRKWKAFFIESFAPEFAVYTRSCINTNTHTPVLAELQKHEALQALLGKDIVTAQSTES